MSKRRPATGRGRNLFRRRGAVTVEMAFVVPVLFVLIFGLIEIARGFMVSHLIQDAARQGCRAAVSPYATNSAVNTKISSLLQAEGVRNATTTILVNGVAGNVSTAKAGDIVRVQISVSASNVTLLPGARYLAGTLQGSYTLRHE